MRKKKSIPAKSRREVAIRYGCSPGKQVAVVCPCGATGLVHWDIRNRQKQGWVTFPGMEIDHIKPEFFGGSSDATNLQLLCTRCNRSKGYKHGEN